MKYTEVTIENVKIHVARVRRSRHFNLSIHQDGEAYATYPWYSSKREFMEFLYDKLSWIKKSQAKMDKNKHEVRIDVKTLERLIKEYISKYIPMFRNDGYDISVHRITIRHMTTRLGSCTPSTGNIRFSTELCKYSDRYIEYVVVHELAHLIEGNHSKRFWDIVKRYIPDCKKMEKFDG